MTDNALKPCEIKAREMLAAEYEAGSGEGPYPTYADLARKGEGRFTQCSLRAIEKALANCTPAPTQPASDQVERVARAIYEACSGPWEFASGQGKDAARHEARAAIAAMRDTKGGV